MKKTKLVIICVVATLTLGIFVGVKFIGNVDAKPQETVVVKIGEETYKITDLEVGAIQDIVKETNVAATPIVEGFKPVNEVGGFIYNHIAGLKKEIELHYKAVVRWGFRGEFDEDNLKYDGKTKTLTIKEPQLTASYGKEMIFSNESLGWAKYLFSPTSYDDAALYDKQSIEIIEDAIIQRVETGREKVRNHLEEEVDKLIDNGTIEAPIEDIVWEESDEELYITNKEIADFEITEDEEEYFQKKQEELEEKLKELEENKK